MIQGSSSASSAPLHELIDRPFLASRISLPDRSHLCSPPARCQSGTANCQPSTDNRVAFDPHLNSSRSRDASSIHHSLLTIHSSPHTVHVPGALGPGRCSSLFF